MAGEGLGDGLRAWSGVEVEDDVDTCGGGRSELQGETREGRGTKGKRRTSFLRPLADLLQVRHLSLGEVLVVVDERVDAPVCKPRRGRRKSASLTK